MTMVRRFKMYLLLLFLLALSIFRYDFMITSYKMYVKRTENLHYVVFHLDLKGAPPKLQYLKSLLPMLRKFGVNAILMEYNDMFPFKDELSILKSAHCYKKAALRDFLKYASSTGFEIIPLVQTIGHMEYVLKHPEFQHLRERIDKNTSLCPTKNESQNLVQNMLKQVLDFHNAILPVKHIHIGCDEVYFMNKCLDCRALNTSSHNIYLRHLTNMVQIIKSLYPHTTILMWDDMLRKLKPQHWLSIKKEEFKILQPVYWKYEEFFTADHNALKKYRETMGHIWVASAYKGADGMTSMIPCLSKRFKNHIALLSLTNNYTFEGEGQPYNFKGIILTGWSRFYHTAPLCELLPLAIPSLFLNLLLVRKFKNKIISPKTCSKQFEVSNEMYRYYEQAIQNDMTQFLACKRTFKVGSFIKSGCKFGASNLYELNYKLQDVVLHIINNVTIADNEISELIFQNSTRNYSKDFRVIRDSFTVGLSKYYDEYVIKEYISLNIQKLINLLLIMKIGSKDIFNEKIIKLLKIDLQRQIGLCS